MPAGRPRKNPIENEKEEEEEILLPNLDDFNHCFRCGWNGENGAKLRVYNNEKICQKCYPDIVNQ